jgi:glycosyltransferase involved in cell wall biosynthesis
VSEEEKSSLYSGAKGFIFPSLYEGFGLPVLEAQSLGVPVLTSNVASLPEVGGDSALYVDPTNVNDIASGMTKLATDEILARELIKKGFKNVDRFSPEAEAKETLEVIKNY